MKLAKLWERSKDAAVAYHSSYYAEKFRDGTDKRLVGVYIDITGNKEIYKRPEMVHLLKDCKKGAVNLIFSQTRAYLAANQSSTVLDEPEREAGTTSIPIPQPEESENIPLPDLPGQLENVQQSGNEIAERGMPT